MNSPDDTREPPEVSEESPPQISASYGRTGGKEESAGVLARYEVNRRRRRLLNSLALLVVGLFLGVGGVLIIAFYAWAVIAQGHFGQGAVYPLVLAAAMVFTGVWMLITSIRNLFRLNSGEPSRDIEGHFSLLEMLIFFDRPRRRK